MTSHTPARPVATKPARIGFVPSALLLLLTTISSGATGAATPAAAQDVFGCSSAGTVEGWSTCYSIYYDRPPRKHKNDDGTLLDGLTGLPNTIELLADKGPDPFVTTEVATLEAPPPDIFERALASPIYNWAAATSTYKRPLTVQPVIDLQGATNGTICGGEYGYDWKKPPIPTKTISIVFDKRPTRHEIATAIKELHLSAGKLVRKPLSFCQEEHPDRQKLLDTIADAVYGQTTFKTDYEIVMRGNDGALQTAGKLPRIFIAYRTSQQEALIELYQQAAAVDPDPINKKLFTAAGALQRSRWDEAWSIFSAVYDDCPQDGEVAEEICDFYRQAPVRRETELAVWLSRLLRTTRSWETFTTAWEEREAIEWANALKEEAENQKQTNMHWDTTRMPLKVFFKPATVTVGDNQQLTEQFRSCVADWSIASNERLDYVVVDSAEKADLQCGWVAGQVDYDAAKFDHSRVPPVVPKRRHLADAFITPSATDPAVIDKATIAVYVYFDVPVRPETFRLSLLHETGHAFGIRRHLDDDPTNIMHWTCDADCPPQQLSKCDIAKMKQLYAHEPISHTAVERFVALPALCNRGPTEASSGAPTITPETVIRTASAPESNAQ